MTIRRNQVTLAARDMSESIAYYQRLGLNLIVDSAPRYVRFEFPVPNDGSVERGSDSFEPATLSLHQVGKDWQAPTDWPLIYFEVDNVANFLKERGLKPLQAPEMKSYLWEEADIIDPAGQRLRIYSAGQNRRFPPWRIN